MLTARFVATVKPTTTRKEYPDRDGLLLRVSVGGVKSWAVRYRVGGGRRGRKQRLTIGTFPAVTLKAARKAARTAIGKVQALGIDPAAEKQAKRRGETFGELAIDYLNKHAKHKRDHGAADAWYIDSKLKQWKSLKVRDITRRDVRGVLDAIAATAPVTANRCLAVIRKVFNYALSQDWIESNPAAHLAKPGGPERARDRVLDDSEVREIWAALDAESLPLQVLSRLELLTAQRGGEIRKMRHADLDLNDRDAWWTIPATDTKNGLVHRVPLTPQVVALLRSLPVVADDANPRGYVFPGQAKKPLSSTVAKRIAPRICKRVIAARTAQATDGEPPPPFHFTAHDARRTATTNWAKGGIKRDDQKRVLNHIEKPSRDTTAVYDRYEYDREKRAVLIWWSATLDAILKNEPAKVLPFVARPA